MMQCTRQSRSGFALSIVMWIVAALLLGIVFIVSLSRENLVLTGKLHDKLDARMEAESVLEALKFVILTSDYDLNSLSPHVNLPYKFPKKIILDGRKYALSKEITIALKDSSSMFNVMHPNSSVIAKMLMNNDRELYYTLRDSIKDWIDSDNVVRLNGAERAYYKLKKNIDYVPRNSPTLQSVDELKLIKGLDSLSDEHWKSLKNNFYFAKNGMLNLMLVKSEILQDILQLSSVDMKMLERYKREGKVKDFIIYIKKNPNYDEGYMNFTLSFKIKIDIIVKNHTSFSELQTFIDFKSLSDSSLSVGKFEIY